MGEVLEHELVVGRVAHIHPAVDLRVEVASQQLAHDPARALQLVVRAEPAVDVDAAHGGVHACGAQDRHALVDPLLGQVCELAVVDGDVRFASGRVGRAAGAGHPGFDVSQHLLHAGEMGCARGCILLISF